MKTPHLQNASMQVTKIAGSLLANPEAVASSVRAAAVANELEKLAALRVALTRYENELRAFVS
jgi:hypothetical protein